MTKSKEPYMYGAKVEGILFINSSIKLSKKQLDHYSEHLVDKLETTNLLEAFETEAVESELETSEIVPLTTITCTISKIISTGVGVRDTGTEQE